MRAFIIFLFLLTSVLQVYCQADQKSGLVVQYNNRSSISRIAFHENGNLLASVDASGFLVVRNLQTQLNTGSLQLENEEINFVKFEGDLLLICGDKGIEILVTTSGSLRKKQVIRLEYAHHFIKTGDSYYILASHGKLFSTSHRQMEESGSPNLIADLDGQFYRMTMIKDRLHVLGSRAFVVLDAVTGKIISRKVLAYNIGFYGTVQSAAAGIFFPAYEKNKSALSTTTGNVAPWPPAGYKAVKLGDITGEKIGEMSIKAATLIDDKRKTIYLPEHFTASAISSYGIVALGDYHGNVFLYDPETRQVVNRYSSGTSVNQLVALSADGNMLALSSGNTRTAQIKVINLSNGRVLYEEESSKPDLSALGFYRNDSALALVYPDGGIEEIRLYLHVPEKSTLTKSVSQNYTRNMGMMNFTLGGGEMTAYLAEQEFLKQTMNPGRYDKGGLTTLQLIYQKGVELPKNKMPPASTVNALIEQFELGNEESLFDQLEKDLLVMKAINYDIELYMAAVRKNGIDSVKAMQLFNFVRSPASAIIVRGGVLEKEVTLQLKEPPRGIFVDEKRLTVYTIGEERIWKYDLLKNTVDNFVFRKKGSMSNYLLNMTHQVMVNLDGNRVDFHQLDKMIPQFNLYSFKGSMLYESPEGYYFTTSRVPQMAFQYKDQVFHFEQFDTRYNRPDKVLTAMGSNDTSLIASYKTAYNKRIKRSGIDTALLQGSLSVPESDIINRNEISQDQKSSALSIHIRASDENANLERLNIWVNESPLFGRNGISLRTKYTRVFDTTIIIQLSAGENRIETSVVNVIGTESYRLPLQVRYVPAVPVEEKMHFVGIGINRYAEAGHDLKWSVRDIRELAKSLKIKYGNNISIDTLFDEQVTIANIAALKAKLSGTTIHDKVIISYSGHGLLSSGYDYYLSTYPVNFSQPEQGGLPYEMLENLVDGIPARKKLLLIDACHSGEVDKEEMEKYHLLESSLADSGTKSGRKPVPKEGNVGMQNSFELMQQLFVDVSRSTGATVISAASGTQFAQEKSDLQNGVFTYSILEYMQNHPSATVSGLRNYVNKRVPELTMGMQVPTTRAETKVVDWKVW